MQYGGMPKDAKPFKGIGSGVIEIALRHDGEAYRTVVALQLGRTIYVLHAFQKKSKKGIATPKQDVDLIKQRYKEAKELAEDEQELNRQASSTRKARATSSPIWAWRMPTSCSRGRGWAFMSIRFLTDRKLKQREIATLLGIKQPEVSHLMNGHFSRFTADKLLDFLKRLDQKVTIRISPHRPGEPYQEIGIGY